MQMFPNFMQTRNWQINLSQKVPASVASANISNKFMNLE